MEITTKQLRPKWVKTLVPVQRQVIETNDSGRVQRLIENKQPRNPTARTTCKSRLEAATVLL